MDTATSSAASASASNVVGLTCATCGETFEKKENQREHMRSEWHVYNLKRNIADLPPLSSNVFEERVKTQRIQDIVEEDNTSFFKACPSCNREFYNVKAWKNHVEKSKCTRELELERGMETLNLNARHEESGSDGSDEDIEDEEDENENDPESFITTKCLFCSHSSPSTGTNISHMHKIHGLFIPDQEYLTDISSLLSCFHAIIYEFFECLYCGREFTKGGGEAVRMHMIGKGHCKFGIDEDLEDFWDFGDDDEGSEDGSDAEETRGKGRSRESEILVPENDGSIRLPSGKTLGHRSKAHIYRQNTSHYQGTPEERLAKRKLALEELKSANSAHSVATEPSQGETEVEEDAAVTTNSKEKVSMAISTLVNSRVRGVNRGEVTRRMTDQTSLAGLTEVERKAVVLRERKMIKKEMRARNEQQWKVEKKGNEQGTFMAGR